jgi:hypothetical protein
MGLSEAQRQCERINREHGRSRGNRFCVRTPWPEPEPEPEPEESEPEQAPKLEQEHASEPEPEQEALELESTLSPSFAAQLLTVIVTTSPTTSNPCTRLTAAVMRSLGLVEGLLVCPKVIVCDGYVCAAKCNYKKGRITDGDVEAYQQYVQNLRGLIETDTAFVNAKLIQLEKRHGFAFAVRRALDVVTTRFVMVVQHDRLITRPFDLRSVLHAFDADPSRGRSDQIDMCTRHGRPSVKYIAFQTRQTVGGAHQARVRSRANGRHVVFPPPLTISITAPQGTGTEAGAGQRQPAVVLLEPLAFWYDSTHCCEAAHYREFIFQETLRREEGLADDDSTRTRLRLGDFVEDTVGHQLLDAVKAARGFEEAHEPYGTYLWNDGVDEVHVRHIDGRKYLSPEQREERGYSTHGQTKFEQYASAAN